MMHNCILYSYPLFSWAEYDVILNTDIFKKPFKNIE